MAIQNQHLFHELTELERRFILEEEYPWQALERMMELLSGWSCVGHQVPPNELQPCLWPEDLPAIDPDRCKTSLSSIRIDRIVHVRGGEELQSDEDVHIQGPVILGRKVVLRKGAVVTGPSYIGDGVVIGQGCRVKNSIIRPGVQVSFGTYVSHCILGKDVFIHPGANLNDKLVKTGGEIICRHRRSLDERTGRIELGLMAGDEAVVGGGSTICPGVLLPRQACIKHGAVMECFEEYLETHS